LARTERLRRGRAATALRGLAPVLDGAGRRGEALAQPQLDLAVRQLEWVASAGDPARHYLLLRNAWDFNAPLLRRVYTPHFLERLTTRTRGEFDGLFTGRGSLAGEVVRAEFSTKMVSDLLHN